VVSKMKMVLSNPYLGVSSTGEFDPPGEKTAIEALYLQNATHAPSKCGEHSNEVSQPYLPVD